jgi:hypothetical protein
MATTSMVAVRSRHRRPEGERRASSAKRCADSAICCASWTRNRPMTDPRPVLHLKPAKASPTPGSVDRLASLIDTAARQQPHTVRAEQNRGKLLHAAFPDRPDVLAMLLQVANASGCSASASPSCAVAFRLLQSATMPSATTPLCSAGCGGPRDRQRPDGTWRSYCRKCHNADSNDRQKAERRERVQLLKRQRGLARPG